MAESPPLPVTPRPRRWGRRVALGLSGALLGLAGLAAVVWGGRVALLNRWLIDDSSVWRVQVERLDLAGGRLQVRGLRVSHADQTEPVFAAGALSAVYDWKALKMGRLGSVTVDSPTLHWRAGLRSDAAKAQAAPNPAPMVVWDSLQITKGKIDAADPGSFSFTGAVAGHGGAGAWHGDGRLALSPHDLTLTDPAYAAVLAGGPAGTVAVDARQLDLTASLNAATGTLTISRAALAGSRVRLAGPATAAETVPDNVADAGGGSPDLVSGVRLSALSAPALVVEGTLPWALSGRADLELASLQAGPGVPFALDGLRLGQASASLAHGARLPQFTLAAGLREGIPRVDSLTFSGAEVPDVAALLTWLGLPAPEHFGGSFEADGDLRGLAMAGGLPASGVLQTLTVRELKLSLPGPGVASAARCTLTAIPDELRDARRFRLVEVVSPGADLLLQAVLPALREAPASGVLPSAVLPRRPAWEGWTADVLTIAGGTFAATLPQAGGARVTTAWAVSTTPAAEAGPGPHYQISLTRPQMVQPDFPDQPVALAGVIQVTASAAGLWQRREIDSLTVAGSRIQIGDALFRLVQALPPAQPAPPVTSQLAPPPPVSPPWLLRNLVLEDALIQIDHLGDRRRLDIPVTRQEFHDLPLDAGALAEVDRVYKIEVPNITLCSPFSAGQKVAVLDTNYIQFTPSGLLQRRLERVDLMLPSLYAGQPLFDFVDAARKRFSNLAAGPSAGPQPLLVDAAARSATVLRALARVTPSEDGSKGQWEIPFYTESGKVYVAPKGYPWASLPVIPFRNARDAAGRPVPFLLHGETFHGELAIEPGWYEFPEYRVRLRLSDRGRIIFNTPQQDRDNNLTEVFEKNTLIFRQIQVDDAWLSITYDARGIYARFGGRTCGGTLTGGINLYLDELYTWDAWASLIDIGMKPLTDKLSPDTFRMTGPVDELTVKAYGDTTTLYQAALELKVSRPGTLQILALDAMKKKIEAFGGLRADLGEITLATVRDFAYTGCTGSLKLFGTEGQGHLSLTGPAGSRTINLRLHDYRATLPKTAAPF